MYLSVVVEAAVTDDGVVVVTTYGFCRTIIIIVL